MFDFVAGRRAWMRAAIPALLLGLAGTPVARAEAPARPDQATITVFAAASLTNAFEDIGKLYAAKAGAPDPTRSPGGSELEKAFGFSARPEAAPGKRPVRFAFAASSALAKQLEAGAPAGIFASADQTWMAYAAARGLVRTDSIVSFLGNALVLVAPAGKARPVALGPGMDLAAWLGPQDRIATGLVDSVPVGIYAKAAFTSLGVWDQVAPRIVGTESVRAALALVERGEAPYGVVYATDAAIARNVKVVAIFPADSHPPVEYPFALVKGQDTDAARAFFAFLAGPEAREVYRRYGFSVR